MSANQILYKLPCWTNFRSENCVLISLHELKKSTKNTVFLLIAPGFRVMLFYCSPKLYIPSAKILIAPGFRAMLIFITQPNPVFLAVVQIVSCDKIESNGDIKDKLLH